MRDRPTFMRYFRFWRADVRADADDEIDFHLEMRVRDLVARGLSPVEARAEAEREFGDVRAIREQVVTIDGRRQRQTQRREYGADLSQDLRLAFRALRRSPGFTLMAVLCIALGIGVTTTIFSAVNAILLRPLPYPRSDELVAIYGRIREKDVRGTNISYENFESWRDENRTFAAVGIWTWSSLALSGEGEPERVEGASVSANLFPLLGVRPLFGRNFLPAEERLGHDKVILLGYDLWQRRYGADPGIVGRTVPVDGVPYEVVGVMPPRFNFPDRGQAWVPMTVEDVRQGRGNRFLAGAIGRLRTGVSIDQGRGDLERISLRLQKAFPEDNFGWDTDVVALRDDLVGDLRQPLLVFLGAVAFVLLIACANVASLMLARGASRQQEVAIRVALGAGRMRIVRQVLTESMVIAAAGGGAGLVLARYGVRLVDLAFPGGAPFYFALGVDRMVVLFAVLVTVTTGLLFGIVPALSATNVELERTLREGGRAGSDGRQRRRLRGTLVVSEVALSVVLLIGATLLIRSYRALVGTDLGFDTHGILSARMSLPESKYADRGRRGTFYETLYARIAALPGVVSVGSAQGIPFSGWNVQAEMTIEGHPAPRQGDELVVLYQNVSPDYFRTIGVPIARGRGLSAADRDSTLQIGVINETLAQREFPGEDPVGKRIKWGGIDSRDPWMTIVGVARDFRHYRLPMPMGPAIYLPMLARPNYSQTLAIRTTLADPLALVPAVRGIVRGLDPELPLYAVHTFEQVVERSVWRQRFQGQVLGIFAGLALILATIGIYGIIAWNVAQRTRELGVRMALGASRGQVVGLVVKQGTRLTLAGLAIGVAGAFALTRVLATLLYGVRPLDPLSFAGVPLLLAVVALIASWVPARRAARVDPVVAMRVE